LNATPTSEDAALAHDLLAAFAQLRKVEAKGAQLRREFRNEQIGSEEWAWWYDHHYEPAYTKFDEALVAFEQQLGDEFPGRHPWDFVQMCRNIINTAPDDVLNSQNPSYRQRDPNSNDD
jgi:hypothetical protein